MPAKSLWVNLRYRRADLQSIFAYAVAHDVERDGRYDVQKPRRLIIWTHTWSNPACNAESTLMFSLEFDMKTGSLLWVIMQRGYNWRVFCDELARLEMAALGRVVWGEPQAEPIV
jgi:hypothetical protein